MIRNATELKRSLAGKTLLLVERAGMKVDPPWVRPVLQVRSTDVILSKGGTKSFLFWPPASLITIEENGFAIHDPGIRPLTSEEQALIDNEPRDKEQEEIDAISDGSTMYRRRHLYYSKEHPDFEYLGGCVHVRGCRLRTNTGKDPVTGKHNPPQVTDDHIKGAVTLRYIYKEEV